MVCSAPSLLLIMVCSVPPAYYGLFSPPSLLWSVQPPPRLLYSVHLPQLVMVCSAHSPTQLAIPQLILICPAPQLIMACSPSPNLACYNLYIPSSLLWSVQFPQVIMICSAPPPTQLTMVCSAPSPHPACYGLFTGGWSKMAAVGP